MRTSDSIKDLIIMTACLIAHSCHLCFETDIDVWHHDQSNHLNCPASIAGQESTKLHLAHLANAR